MNIRPLLFLTALFWLSACAAPTADPATPTVEPTLEAAAPAEGAGCRVLSPDPEATAVSIIPAVGESDFVTGPEEALVTIIEYCDFQAPICQSMAAVISNVVTDHVEDVRFVFRPVPLIGQLDKTELGVQAAVAAGNQDRFWEMYNALFQKNDEWSEMTLEAFEAWLLDEAGAAGMDRARFATDLRSTETVNRMTAMYDSARNVGLQAVPLLIINGKPQPSFAIDHLSIESTVSLLTLSRRQFTECPPFSIDPDREYIATLQTEKGTVVLRLFPRDAPLAVNSFVFLARQGWFDDVPFHRVIPGFMAQTGDPSGSGRGGPGYFFENEIDPGLKFDRAGLVGMANSGPDSNGSQFFITYAPAPHLDGGYTIFGEVLSGLEVLEQLTARDPEQPNQPEGDLLLRVEIEER